MLQSQEFAKRYILVESKLVAYLNIFVSTPKSQTTEFMIENCFKTAF